ncbi:dethiobiotin synthetase [Methanosarcina sp. 1.H.T.1A.1]|uniref:dethiobiotin synthase n=1 Tax=Methanosarcina sp. 1.H.T.1A.1 TaxID=1483602 RepID=UPI0006221057|nr:dethiobiotin synthase [Methanosarcina sp. 1.H.T.1A.1]KKH92431.1 dethiobiotin synthetase [Methanosarcina sp. 1.H.T.1A.1]
MSKGLFITGTGTDVGKTFTTALIVKKLRENGLNAGYYKAALSGAEKIKGKLVAGDAKYVCEVSGITDGPESLVSYIYETAVSPHLAAQIEKLPIEMNVIDADFEQMKTRFDYVTVEGSGGIICPLRRDEQTIMLTDVIKRLNLDVLIVAPSSLGTINSTVLTIEYAKQSGIAVKGIILNGYMEDNFLHVDNKFQIEQLTETPVIACVPKNSNDLAIPLQVLTDLFKEI